MDQMTHEAHGQEADPHAGHKMSKAHGNHDRHAGHSVAMFRDKFWLSFALTIPVLFWSTDVQHWLRYTAPSLPRLDVYPRRPRNGGLHLWRTSLHPRGVGRTGRPQARHDDSHQPGDHSRLRDIARRNIRLFRD